MHDAYRVDRAGDGTFDRVLRAARLMQEHGVDFNVLCTVHAANAGHPEEVYCFFRDELGAQWVQFIPIVERINADGTTLLQEGDVVTERSVSPEAWGAFLNGVFDEWVRRDVGNMYINYFEAALASWAGAPAAMCIFAETCGEAMALEHNGDLYSCDHFVEPGYLLGNIMETPLAELAASDRQTRFGEGKRDTLPRYCLDCEVLFACRGECPKNRFTLAPDGEPGLNYLCRGLQGLLPSRGLPHEGHGPAARVRPPRLPDDGEDRRRMTAGSRKPARRPAATTPAPAAAGKSTSSATERQRMSEGKKSLLNRYLPLTVWLPAYKREYLKPDLIAGLSVWAVTVPSAMAYAGIAGLPVQYGLYSACFAVLAYAFFGTSREVIIGPEAAAAAISAAAVAPLAGDDVQLYAALSMTLALVAGVLFIAGGFARLGFVAKFFARPVINAFVVGLAVYISVEQLGKMFGISVEGDNTFRKLADVIRQFGDWSWVTLGLAAACLVLLFRHPPAGPADAGGPYSAGPEHCRRHRIRPGQPRRQAGRLDHRRAAGCLPGGGDRQ